MSVEIWKIEKNLCRCCHSDGAFDNLAEPKQNLDQEEIYCNMLKESFNIEIIPVPGELCAATYTICQECITRLQDASSFRKQILDCEGRFMDLYLNNTIKVISSEKESYVKEEDVDSEADMKDIYMSLEDDNDDEYDIKQDEDDPESDELNTNLKNRKAKVKSKSDKPKSSQRTKHRAKESKSMESTSKKGKCIIINRAPLEIDLEEKKEDITIRLVRKQHTDLQKHRNNIKEILQGSNATPIRCHKDRGYTCIFCENEFEKPSDLKKHNLDCHTYNLSTKEIENLVPALYDLCVKLDITDLTCNLCQESIDSVEELCDHVQHVHDRTIFNDIVHQILPFKFNEQILQCHICNNIYNKFKKLMEHMNVHYSNYICDVCEAGFVNKTKLRNHKIGHNSGDFKCEMCTRHFDTYGRKMYHQRRYHDKNRLFYKCGYCNALFKGIRAKEIHLVKEHGVASSARKCQACDKMFSHQKGLNSHIRSYHLVERKHKCPECDKTFFAKAEVRKHMHKHTRESKYKCEICSKSFARKWTLRQHLRIHSDDRRFKCEHCGQSFLQKCTWRAHMRSQHGEQV